MRVLLSKGLLMTNFPFLTGYRLFLSRSLRWNYPICSVLTLCNFCIFFVVLNFMKMFCFFCFGFFFRHLIFCLLYFCISSICHFSPNPFYLILHFFLIKKPNFIYSISESLTTITVVFFVLIVF